MESTSHNGNALPPIVSPQVNDSRIFDAASSTWPASSPAESLSPPSPPATSEKEEEITPGYIVHDLRKPITVDGKEVRSITLDFDSMPGETLMNIENEMRADEVHAPLNPVMSTMYCQYIAARAAGMNVADLRRLGFKDLSVIIMRVQNFMTS
ncbi:MAG: phage tail assembly protein [Planctomycetaceae bacterium]|nr:phage tail assembly protein [Planctomycetaceae bacterium]